MKNTQIGMLASIVFAVGMVGINFSDGSFMMQNDTPAPMSSGVGVSGHLEIIHSDSEGNILSYQQTDNAIVNDGRNCTAMLLFGDHTDNGCDAGSPAGLGVYTTIGIGNTTALPAGSTNQVELPSEILDNGIARVTASSLGTFTNSTGEDNPATQRISAVFTWGGANTNTVLNAGLFNQTTPGATSSTFALKDFPSSVAMNTNDQLTVNWDISIDGSSATS